jgi:sugar phosphate isomerase/epimerase
MLVSMSLTRRQLAALFAAVPGLGATKSARRIDITRIGAITDEIAYDEAGAIAFAKKYGIQWLELRTCRAGRERNQGKGEYFKLPEADLKASAEAFRRANLRVSFLNTSMLKYALPGAPLANERHRASERRYEQRQAELEQAIRAARIFGASKIRIFTFMRAPDPAAVRGRVAAEINALAKTAEREGIQLLIENEGACNAASCGELAELMKLIPSKAIGINWDPFNAENAKEIAFPDGYRMLDVRRIGNVQIKGKSLLREYTPMDWPGIFRQLEKDGYTGQVGLETHIFGEVQIQKSHDSMMEIRRLFGLPPVADRS